MKVCPHCGCQYEDDFLFCLTDGNALLESGGEVETVGLPVFDLATPGSGQPFATVACPSCGTENRSNSSFCKKCGVHVDRLVSPKATTFGNAADAPPAETVAFAPAMFAPPKATAAAAPARTAVNQNILLGAILGAIVAIGGLVIYSMQGGSNSDSNTRTASASGNGRSATPTHPDVGRSGRLTTNQRIRSGPTLDSQILGVHYYNARIRVLDAPSYSTNDGSMIWYRVKVLENGCDYEGIRGCGNNLDEEPGAAAMEGWTSAKNITLD